MLDEPMIGGDDVSEVCLPCCTSIKSIASPQSNVHYVGRTSSLIRVSTLQRSVTEKNHLPREEMLRRHSTRLSGASNKIRVSGFHFHTKTPR